MTPALLALALAASSATTLGVYVVGDDATSQTLLAACPAVAVFPLPGVATTTSQIASLRQTCPLSQIVLQVGGMGRSYSTLPLPAVEWNATWFSQVTIAGGRPGDWIEGPTEIIGGTSTQLAEYWTGFATLVHGAGYRSVVGGLATGAPPAVALGDGGTENVFCETLRRMAQQFTGWAWSQHGLAPSLDTTTLTPLLAYRTTFQQCAANGGPATSTLFLTMLGRTTGAWQTSDLSWLAWLDGQLQQDGVGGVALFQTGGSDRSLSPIATNLAAYLQNPTPADGGVPDGGTDGGSQNGVVPPGGGIIPSGPAGQASSGCATAGAGFGLLTVLPLLLARRRARRRDDTDGGRAV